MLPTRTIHLLLALAATCLLPATAHAAQSLDTCAGYVDSVPATITTQGVWCLRHDLSTNITSGAAITIATNNVTIDCNDFKLGGLAAGDSSQANGIQSNVRQNATVRHCNVRGFLYGLFIAGGAGHLVEDNRLDNNLHMGIYLTGDNNLVQRNRIFDTGGSPSFPYNYGIDAEADILDNLVSGVFATTSNASPIGIIANRSGVEVGGNRVRNLLPKGTGTAVGIQAYGSRIRVDGNHVVSGSVGVVPGVGIFGSDGSFCTGNTVAGFSTAYFCASAIGNLP